MKKLDEVEPRTNLQATPAAVGVDTTNPSYHFIISQPGSYYLSANVLVTKANGIQISAEGVTLDLNGFQVSGVTAAGNGIEVSNSSHHSIVRNGTVKGFAYGINGGTAKACAFRDLALTSCTSYGIFAGPASILESCRAHDNSGFSAIFADLGSSFTNCTALDNAGGINYYGIRISRGGTAAHCTASSNSGVGFWVGEGAVLRDSVAYFNGGIGIQGKVSCSIIGCSAQHNSSTGITTEDDSTVSNCTISSNDVGGLFVFNEAIITGCVISSNKGDGVRCNGYNTFEQNAITLNGAAGAGDGINVVGFANRIDSNQIRFSTGAGIRLPNNSQNVVTRNMLGGNNAGNYLVGTGNGIGPIISISAGNVGNATNSPFANIQD